MKPILLIDWSVISYKCWHRMGSDNYEPSTPTEKAEFAKNIFSYVTYLKERFNPSLLVFAVDDNPNWRVEYYRKYYIDNSNLFFNKDTNTYITEWDFKLHSFKHNTAQDIWVKDSIKKEERYDVVLGMHTLDDKNKKQWTELLESTAQKVNKKGESIEGPLPKSMYDEYVWEKFFEKGVEGADGFEKVTDLEVKRTILYDTLYAHAPRYKKRNKTKNWDYETPYEEFKNISTNLAFNLARTFGAKAIRAEGAEADDVIAAYVEGVAKTSKDCIVVSVDTDLQQLLMKNMFFKFYNPNMFEGNYSAYGGFVNMSTDKVKYELYKKILSGDTSDTIYATFLKGSRKLMSEAEAEKILLEKEKPLQFAQKAVDRKVLIKNNTLVHLGKRPKYIYDNIVNAIKSYRPTEEVYFIEDFLVTPVELMTIKEQAKDHAKYDNQSGRLE